MRMLRLTGNQPAASPALASNNLVLGSATHPFRLNVGSVYRVARPQRFCRVPCNGLNAGMAECSMEESLFSSDMLETTSDTVLNSCRCLVLDVACRPVSVLSWKRAVCLDLLDKVEVLEYYDVCVRSVSMRHPIPAVLRAHAVLNSVRVSHVPLSRTNVLIRDDTKCAYCGSRSKMTIDHVVPVSKGGKQCWENVVAACERCNNKKGDRMLKSLGWKLKTAPREPSPFDPKFLLLRAWSGKSPKQWAEYLPGLQDFKM